MDRINIPRATVTYATDIRYHFVTSTSLEQNERIA